MTGLGAGCGVRMGWLADGIEGKVEGEDAVVAVLTRNPRRK